MSKLQDLLIGTLIIVVVILILFMRSLKDSNEEIIGLLKSNNTCSLPYGVQDKIEQTYENITSATCTTNN